MANIVKLNYTADEINEKLGKVKEDFALFNHLSFVPEWDTVNKTLTIPQGSRLLTATEKYWAGMTTANVVLDLLYERGIVCYDAATGVFNVYTHDPASGSIPEDSLLIASYAKYGEIVHMSGAYKIDGNLFGIVIPEEESKAEWGTLFSSMGIPEFNTTAKTFTTTNTTANSSLYVGDEKYDIPPTTINLQTADPSGYIVYSKSTGAITSYYYGNTNQLKSSDYVIIAFYSYYGANVWMLGKYKVDGKIFGLDTSGGGSTSETKSTAFGLLAQQSIINRSLMFDTNAKTVKIYANNIIGGATNKAALTPVVTLNLFANGCIVYDYSDSTFKNVGHAATLTDTQMLIAAYTNYGKAGVSTACNFSVDGYPYGINTDEPLAPRKITSPCYERIPLPLGTPMWSDLFAIGDNIIGMVQSTDEDNIAKNGKVLIFDTNFALKKTLYHDFGHCNTCHYNANTDTLLIGNLPGSTEYPAALYIFYDVSDWLDLAENTVLEFNNLNPTIINLAGLKTAYPAATSIAQIAACWGDCNADENNLVYVSSQYDNWWFKIALGKGTNQYTYGTYTEVEPTKFNGTFNALEMYTRNSKYDAHEVTQGMEFYNGQPVTAEGHNGARVLRWNFNTVSPYAYGKEMDWKPFDYVNAATYETQLNYIYNPDGTILKVATEGIVIKDGYMYIGVFFYDNGNGSKPSNSVFENSVFKYKL